MSANERSGSAPGEYGECGPGGANGLRVMAHGQTAAARRDGLLDGRLQTRDRATEQRKLKTQRKLADGPYLAHGVMVSGVRSAAILFATEAHGTSPFAGRGYFLGRRSCASLAIWRDSHIYMAGLGNNPVQGFRTQLLQYCIAIGSETTFLSALCVICLGPRPGG
jgi:hypothetical protein